MMTLKQLMATFPDETACKQFLMERRWPKGVRCPRCGNDKVYESKSRAFHWQCKECPDTPKGQPYRFSVLVGTVFENTNYPLKTWFEVLWQMLNTNKGVSAMHIQRQIGSSYPTAWFICHRLRAGMRDDGFLKLMGIVEVDETYIGGKNKNRHLRNKTKGGGTVGKTPVIGEIARKGNLVCQVINDTSIETLSRFVRKAVSEKVDLVATDEAAGYRYLGQMFPHEQVDHKAHEYVRGEVHTNNLESFWSLLKRGIMGTYHNVSKKYLPLYLAEFQFRHNNRKNPDIFGTAIGRC
jgi:transposase-like protein